MFSVYVALRTFKFAFGRASPRATPKSAPALQTWAASNAGSVVNGRSTTPPAKATSSHSVATTTDGIFTKRNKFNLHTVPASPARHLAAASRRLQLQRSTALRARLNARALTAPRTLPTPASHLCHTTRNASPSIASVKGVNRAILDRRAKLASELSRRA